MTTSEVNTTRLRSDDIIVDENDQELPVGTVVHCLGALFKVTNSGIRHLVGKIEDNTYFADPQYFHQLNELAFSEKSDVTTTPDAAPQKEGLLAFVYRIVTAPFSMRTPKNVRTRHKKRKSSPSKLVHINEIADNLTLKAENPGTTSLGTSHPNDSMNVPLPNEMYLLNAQCEKCITEEVQIYLKVIRNLSIVRMIDSR